MNGRLVWVFLFIFIFILYLGFFGGGGGVQFKIFVKNLIVDSDSKH